MMRLINKPSLSCRNCQILSRSHFSTFSTKQISNPVFNGQTVLPVRFVRKYKGNKGTDYTVINYAVAMCVTMLGVSYAAVPLYKKFCQVSRNPYVNYTFSLMQMKFRTEITKSFDEYKCQKRKDASVKVIYYIDKT